MNLCAAALTYSYAAALGCRLARCAESVSLSTSVGRRVLFQFQRLRQRVHFEPVMFDLLDLVPRKTGRVLDRFLQFRRRVAVRDNVKPVEVAPVFGDPLFIWRQKNTPGSRADAFDLDQPEFAGHGMQAAEVETEVLFLHVFNLAAASMF